MPKSFSNHCNGKITMTRQPLLSKPKAKRAQPEAQLQRAVVQVLCLMALPNVIWYSSTNGVKMAPRTAAHMKSMGMQAGVPDLCFVSEYSHACFMELKSVKGRQSPEQKAFQKKCEDRQLAYGLINNIDDAIDWLVKNYIIKEYRKKGSAEISIVSA
jgi:hypothetical protein